jgi:hypothetical protein
MSIKFFIQFIIFTLLLSASSSSAYLFESYFKQAEAKTPVVVEQTLWQLASSMLWKLFMSFIQQPYYYVLDLALVYVRTTIIVTAIVSAATMLLFLKLFGRHRTPSLTTTTDATSSSSTKHSHYTC